jgi:hypothetical protein
VVAPTDAAAIPAPELSFVRSMADTGGAWQLHGEYSIWSGARLKDEAPYCLHEWHDRRVLPIPLSKTRPVLHCIAAGTPFEVAHLFGFWIVADVDTVWVDAASGEGQRCGLILGGAKGKPGDAACFWVCPRCGGLMARQSFAVPHQRFERFLDFAETQVRAFNADAALRACAECGAAHPPSYGFRAALDGEVERAARAAS